MAPDRLGDYPIVGRYDYDVAKRLARQVVAGEEDVDAWYVVPKAHTGFWFLRIIRTDGTTYSIRLAEVRW